MAEEIKPGDVVQLRSGGPKMTVALYSTTNPAPFSSAVLECLWFDGEKLLRGHFPYETLEPASGG